MSVTKGWDWSKNTDTHWLKPCIEIPYLAEKWQAQGFKEFLDLGCGLGRHSVYMAKHGFSVSSVDLSEYGVEHLRQWADRESLKINAAVSNMLSLPFEDNSFDCIMAYNVIYHTDTKGFSAAVEEIKRVLKSGGELFLTLISKGTYGFSTMKDKSRIVDENTILIDEYEAGDNIPHFHADIDDIKKIFSGDWTFEIFPVEQCEYNVEKPEFFSKHWIILLKKK